MRYEALECGNRLINDRHRVWVVPPGRDGARDAMTDPRAVALYKQARAVGTSLIGRSVYDQDDIIVHALADERRRGMEEAAQLCEAEALIDDERGYYGKEMAKAIRAKAAQ